ncbi:MAG: hydroxyacylglutathione hydrolase [Paraglaciecola sp.]|jgi:hydroxyacylglutathione hydrolase
MNMSLVTVVPIKAYEDNYIWTLVKGGNCVVVDPGDAQPVLNYCAEWDLTITDILITHHHWDHTNGLDALIAAFPEAIIYGPYNPKITQITHRVKEGETVTLASLATRFKVMAIPGHTLDHLAYFSDIGLFCGDTLFSVGCGRLFEGTAKQMHHSLQKLQKLPDETPVYCAHEYTLANIKFAEQVEPDNQDLLNYKEWAGSQRVDLKPTLPSSIGQQKAINPFLRTDSQQARHNAQQHSGKRLTSPEQVFAALRDWKDHF